VKKRQTLWTERLTVLCDAIRAAATGAAPTDEITRVELYFDGY
jgi:hypothetical protein